MNKYYIYIFTVLFLFGCDKINFSKKANKNPALDNAVLAQLAKIKNKFNIAEINSNKAFSLLAIQRNKPCAALFYSDKSVPCVYSQKFINNLSQSMSNDVLFIQINLSDNAVKSLGTKYSIFSVPTLILFNHGREIDRLVGITNIKKYKTITKK